MPEPRVVILSDLNSIQFTERDKSQPARFVKRWFNDGWWYNETVQDHEAHDPHLLAWAQPLRFTDHFCIQARTNASHETIALELYKANADGTGTFIDETGVWEWTDAPGDTYDPQDGVNDPVDLITVQWVVPITWISDISASPGIYYLQMRVLFGAGLTQTTRYFLSEPIDFQTSHPGTLRFDYYNSTNISNTTIFEQITPRPTLRVPGVIEDFDPSSTDVIYTDQNEEQRSLYSVAYNRHTIKIPAVPDYIINKINHIFTCDRVAVENKLVTKDGDSKIEVQRVRDVPLKGMTLTVREAENTTGLISDTRTVGFHPITVTPPFAITYMRLSSSWHTIVLRLPGELSPYGTSAVIDDVAAGEALADDFNDNIENLNLSGTFSFEDNQLRYTMGDGENYEANSVWFDTLMEVDIEALGDDVDFRYTYARGGMHIVDWGDSTVQLKTYAPTYTSTSHEYDTGTYTVGIWTSEFNSIEQLILNFTTGDAVVRDHTGDAPKGLKTFINQASGSMNSGASLQFLVNCNTTLENLLINGCGYDSAGIGQVFEDAWVANGNSVNGVFKYLKQIDARFNDLPEAGVNDFISELASSIQWAFNPGSKRYLKLENQTGTVPPTGGALLQKGTLNSSGYWVVTTD